MTEKDLKQYRSICKEIQEINIRINNQTEYDTVRGSDSEFPYTAHMISVSGVTPTKSNERLLQRLRKLQKQKEDIECFVDGIEDSIIRRIFEYRHLEGSYRLSWQQVAVKIGGGNTENSIKMMYHRYLHKNN